MPLSRLARARRVSATSWIARRQQLPDGETDGGGGGQADGLRAEAAHIPSSANLYGLRRERIGCQFVHSAM